MRATRTAQLLLLVAALLLWGASRLPWVDIASEDGLGPRKMTTLDGSQWSTVLIPLALLVAAAAVAALAVRGWPLRLLALLVAAASAGMGYLAITMWVATDLSVRAADLAHVPVMFLVGTNRHHWGAVLTLAAAACALAAAVLLMRAAGKESTKQAAGKYSVPGSRGAGVQHGEGADGVSERMLWDAIDEGHDPTVADPENGS